MSPEKSTPQSKLTVSSLLSDVELYWCATIRKDWGRMITFPPSLQESIYLAVKEGRLLSNKRSLLLLSGTPSRNTTKKQHAVIAHRKRRSYDCSRQTI